MKKINYLKWDVLMWYTHKVLFLMRLTTVMILALGFQLSAAEGSFVKPPMGDNIVRYEDRLLSVMPLKAKLESASIIEILKNSLCRKATNYELIIECFSTIEVRGRVVDENNTPLEGAVVKVKGSSISAPTNANGEFLLKNVDENAILIISYLGYKAQEVKASRNIGSVKLMASTDRLEEVEINAGYYMVKERERTGSISKITADVIEKQPVSNPLMALQNRVTGLNITQLTGVPGGGFKVQIRGTNSIGAGTNPLYIIDGVNYPSVRINSLNSNQITQDASPLSMINPDDIESIEVLKDADATAIYGSRGANGVILITTKKGSTGAIKINAGFSQGFSSVGHRVDLMNTEQYIAMRMEAFKNDGITPSATDYDINGVWDKNKYTDWQEEMIGGTANIINSSLNISGGRSNSNYLIGTNYYSEGTVFAGDFGFKRGGIHSNINLGSEESLFKFSLNATYNRSVSNLSSSDPTGQIMRVPNAPDVYDQNGKLNWTYNNVSFNVNPMASLYNTIDTKTDNLIGNANLSYKILRNLIVSTSIGYNNIKRTELAKRPNIARSPALNPTPANRTSLFGNNYSNSWIVEPQLTYNLKLGQGKLNALIGMSFQENDLEYRNIQASNFNSDELMENISSASVFSVAEMSYTKYKYAAIFARLNYSLSNKYFLNLTGRRDASSRFGPGKQFANFGAVGAAWVFSDENWFRDNLSIVSFGKLRMSYGITGNDQIADYGFLQLLNSGGTYQGNPTLITSRIANADLAWESNRKAEVAIQLSFFKGKLDIQSTYFRNRSSNQLGPIYLPPSVGSNAIIGNIPAIVQNTGWEIEGTIRLFAKKDLAWSTSLNLTIPRNRLIDYPSSAQYVNTSLYIIGRPVTIRKYYNTNVDQQTGLYVFEDKNGNGIREDADKYLDQYIGQSLYGGLQNSIRYKQFNFDFLISFNKQTGNSYLSELTSQPGFFSATNPNNNMPIDVLNRWENPGNQSLYQKFTSLSENNTVFNVVKSQGNQSFSEASFIRLKNIALNYNFSKKWLSQLRINDLALTIQAQNVFTLTKYKGLDPESQIFGRLPALRTYSIGLKLTL